MCTYKKITLFFNPSMERDFHVIFTAYLIGRDKLTIHPCYTREARERRNKRYIHIRRYLLRVQVCHRLSVSIGKK